MKLQELELKSKSQQGKRVFESYFGKKFSVEKLTVREAKAMLNRVRGMLNEHRATAAFHRSEKNPAYLKLMVMEQSLAARIKEQTTVAPGSQMAPTGTGTQQDAKALQAMAKGASKIAGATGANPTVLTKALQNTAQGKQLGASEKQAMGALTKGVEKAVANPQTAAKMQQALQAASVAESKARRTRRLLEAELQQAQVVMAAQDMVDRVQKMLEDVTAMQFKDLPALVDTVRNEVGMDQAQQFNSDATGAFSTLVQSLQGAKTQLETAQGILTGQAPVVPGETGDMGADLGGELPPPEGEVDAEVDTDIELPGADEEEDELMNLGRGRR